MSILSTRTIKEGSTAVAIVQSMVLFVHDIRSLVQRTHPLAPLITLGHIDDEQLAPEMVQVTIAAMGLKGGESNHLRAYVLSGAEAVDYRHEITERLSRAGAHSFIDTCTPSYTELAINLFNGCAVDAASLVELPSYVPKRATEFYWDRYANDMGLRRGKHQEKEPIRMAFDLRESLPKETHGRVLGRPRMAG